MSPQVEREAALTWQRPYPVRSPAATTGCCWSWKNAFLTMTKSVDLERRTPKCSVSTAMVRVFQSGTYAKDRIFNGERSSRHFGYSQWKSLMVCLCSSWQNIGMNPNGSAESALELSLQGPCSGLLPIFVIAIFIWAGSGFQLFDCPKSGFRKGRKMIGLL